MTAGVFYIAASPATPLDYGSRSSCARHFHSTTAKDFLIHDRDSKFGETVNSAVSHVGLSSVKTSFRSPWQNGVAERWVGSCRRDLLDHVVPINERHLKRLLSEYVLYYHDDRTHLGLEKDTPKSRARAEQKCGSRILSFPRLGGLHHRYGWAA
jgi:putative transposase